MPIPHTKTIAAIQDTFYHGSKDVDASAVQISSSSIPVQFGVLIKASKDNSAKVYIGNSSDVSINTDPTTDGFELAAGEGILLEIDNINKIYAIGGDTGQRVYWVIL